VFEQIIDTTVKRRRERDMGVMSLFGDWATRAPAMPVGRRRLRRAHPIPDLEFDKTDPTPVREGDARPLRVGPPAVRRRGGAAAQGRARGADLQTMDDGATSSSAGSSPISPASSPRRVTRWRCSCSAEDLDASIEVGAPPLRIRVPAALSDDMSTSLKGLLTRHPGESEVFLHLGDRLVVRLPDDFAVSTDNGLVGELRELLGPDAIVL
jgi:DNA polymerase III subunit alpha